MITTQQVMFGVTGQSLVLTVERPLTSVTSVAVYEAAADDTSTAEVATTGAAAVDTTTEATTAAAGQGQADPTKFTVASTAGFVVGRRYLVSKGGVSEAFELARFDTDAALYARHPLGNAYASAATVAGTLRASISVLDAWAADLSNLSANLNPNPRYRVRWVVVHADTGETVAYVRNFDLVRYGAVPAVGPIDVDNAAPGWLDALPPDHRRSRGQPLIDEAVKEIKFRLYSEGLADRALRTAEVYAGLVIAQAVYQLAEVNVLMGRADTRTLDVAKAKVDAAFARLVESPVLAVDPTGGGGAKSNTATGGSLWGRLR